MGFRFRKQVKIFPGLKLNISKKGPSSLSAGKKGATINLDKKGRVAQTIGLPGTGLSYRTDKSTPWWLFWAIVILIGVVWVMGLDK
jgi:hypothetical protein